jgi:hypothetical protein
MTFIGLPTNITDMGVANEDLPLGLGEPSSMIFAVDPFGGPGPAIRISPSIERVMQDPQHIVMLQRAPDQLASMWAPSDPTGQVSCS